MTGISESVATDMSGGAELSRSLKSRHVSMIAIGGIIGAGLFVGSSTTISQAGPAAVFSFAIAGFIILLVMRMISEMAIAVDGVQTSPISHARASAIWRASSRAGSIGISGWWSSPLRQSRGRRSLLVGFPRSPNSGSALR